MKKCSIPNTLPERSRFSSRLAGLALGIAVLACVAGCQTEPVSFSTVPSSVTNVPANLSSNLLSTAVSAPAAEESFVFEPGDTVAVSFPGSPNLNTTQQIRTDGKISLPLIGEVQAAGLSTKELQKKLVDLYAPQLSSKQVTVQAQDIIFSVYVTGAVLRPGKITSDHPLTALDAIMEAGGFDYTTANLKGVVVIRQEGTRTKNYTVNLKQVLKGEKTQSFYLKRDDVVYVPQRFSWF
jgi:polysaccharide biosynthesis/export protein